MAEPGAERATPRPAADLEAAIADVRHAESRLRDEVGRCRSAGMSWAAIGRVFGVSAQAVHKRFGERPVASES